MFANCIYGQNDVGRQRSRLRKIRLGEVAEIACRNSNAEIGEVIHGSEVTELGEFEEVSEVTELSKVS